MKMKDIIIGERYAHFISKHSRSPSRVLVLEKGWNYGDAAGRGVRVKYETGFTGDVRVVLGTEIRLTWEDWLIEQKRLGRIELAGQRARIRMEELADRLKYLFEQAGVDASVNWYTKSINVRFDEEAANNLALVLE